MLRIISFLIVVFAVTAFYTRDTLQTFLKARSPIRNLVARNMTSSATTTEAAKSTSAFLGLPVIPPNDPSLTATTTVPRKIAKAFEAVEQSEGAGATVRRSIGTAKLRNFSPFLMLDHFSVKPGAGFPDHPHYGFETITMLLSGGIDHEDFKGHKGTIWPGDLQFMTAGRGIVHAEMPHPNTDGSPNVGMQLWVDLPEHLKNVEPRYRDLRASEVPQAKSDDGKVEVKVISGRAYGVDSLKELAYTPVWYLDVTVQPGGTFSQPVPYKWNSFIYSISGTAIFGSGSDARVVEQYHNVVWEQDGDAVVVSVDAGASEPCRFILVAGMPLDQKIVQYGPFVGTKPEDIQRAFTNYRSYSNGFERALGWESEIGKSMVH